ncbi:MAG TPA: lipoprotein [Longimicrobium sp.]|nr:lipoprotein [Longimicrobium sp.]
MKRIVWTIPAAFILAGCQSATAPEVRAPAEVSASNSGPTIICTASVPPQCEVKVKPPKS